MLNCRVSFSQPCVSSTEVLIVFHSTYPIAWIFPSWEIVLRYLRPLYTHEIFYAKTEEIKPKKMHVWNSIFPFNYKNLNSNCGMMPTLWYNILSSQMRCSIINKIPASVCYPKNDPINLASMFPETESLHLFYITRLL